MSLNLHGSSTLDLGVLTLENMYIYTLKLTQEKSEQIKWEENNTINNKDFRIVIHLKA